MWKNTSGQDKVGELSEREKLGSWVKNPWSQGKIGELSEIKIKSEKSGEIQLKIPQVREKSRNLVK